MGEKPVPHILIVEPDKLLGRTYVQALQTAGISADWQASAQLALNSMDMKIPDAIFLEVQLPEHNGIEFMYEMRSYPDLQAIPVILVTLVPERELGLTSKIRQQLGIEGYYYKPHTSLEQMITIAKDIGAGS